jgi:hypothetical protein
MLQVHHAVQVPVDVVRDVEDLLPDLLRVVAD